MRRSSKKGNVVKVLSAAALVGALTAGTLPVVAADADVVQVQGMSLGFSVREVLADSVMRGNLINALLQGQSVQVDDGAGGMVELRQRTVAAMEADPIVIDLEEDMYVPYV